jgi:hypothetical protein
MTSTVTAIGAITTHRRFGLLNSRVVLRICAAGSTVVGAVARLMLTPVLGRTLVSISFDKDEPSRTVPASPSIDDESLMSVAPSTRQNFSASSVSTRLHWGVSVS